MSSGDHKNMIKFLVSKGASINAKDEDGKTALMWRSELWRSDFWENKSVVEFLIFHGAELNARDNNGKTALKLAIENKNEALADLLRKHGAKE